MDENIKRLVDAARDQAAKEYADLLNGGLPDWMTEQSKPAGVLRLIDVIEQQTREIERLQSARTLLMDELEEVRKVLGRT